MDDESAISKAAVLSIFGTFVLFCMIALGATWFAQGNDFFLYKVFAPKYEAVRRETFEQSKAYNQGVVQELQNMQFEYVRSNKEQKAALRSIILHRAADYDTSKMPADLATFITGLRREGEGQ